MDCVFFGTPEFSRRILELIVPYHRVRLVVTQPDRNAGRGRKKVPPAVKEFCHQADIPCLQPENLNDLEFIEKIQKSGAQAGLVVSYGGYLPSSVLSSLPGGFINLHPSLLPRHRGAAPVNWAIIKGESKTGLTVIRVTAAMDAGPILRQKEVAIGPEETAGELLMRMVKPGAGIIKETLEDMSHGVLKERLQNESHVSFAPRLKKSDGCIEWSQKARQIVDLIRGVNPWPGAHTYHGQTRITVWKAETAGRGTGQHPGEIISVDYQNGLTVATGEGSIRLKVLQKEGGRTLDFEDFLRGSRWQKGEVLKASFEPGS